MARINVFDFEAQRSLGSSGVYARTSKGLGRELRGSERAKAGALIKDSNTFGRTRDYSVVLERLLDFHSHSPSLERKVLRVARRLAGETGHSADEDIANRLIEDSWRNQFKPLLLLKKARRAF